MQYNQRFHELLSFKSNIMNTPVIKKAKSRCDLVIKNRFYERKGKLYKKSLKTDTFKERQFVVLGEMIFYYKEKGDKQINLIQLKNTQIQYLRKVPANFKFKYCIELQNETRSWVLGSNNEDNLQKWYSAIYQNIEQVSQRLRISSRNELIEDLELEKFEIDREALEEVMQ